jgi:hypothetical protein
VPQNPQPKSTPLVGYLSDPLPGPREIILGTGFCWLKKLDAIKPKMARSGTDSQCQTDAASDQSVHAILSP